MLVSYLNLKELNSLHPFTRKVRQKKKKKNEKRGKNRYLYPTLDTKLEIKSEVDGHIMYLESIQLEGQALKALMKERKDLIQVKL